MQRNCISTLQLHTYTVWCFGQITNWTQIHCRAVFALRLEWCQNFRQYIKGENRADFLYGPKMNLSVDTAQYEENINYWVGVRFVFFPKTSVPLQNLRLFLFMCFFLSFLSSACFNKNDAQHNTLQILSTNDVHFTPSGAPRLKFFRWYNMCEI